MSTIFSAIVFSHFLQIYLDMNILQMKYSKSKQRNIFSFFGFERKDMEFMIFIVVLSQFAINISCYIEIHSKPYLIDMYINMIIISLKSKTYFICILCGLFTIQSIALQLYSLKPNNNIVSEYKHEKHFGYVLKLTFWLQNSHRIMKKKK